jgi:hypothetical protein
LRLGNKRNQEKGRGEGTNSRRKSLLRYKKQEAVQKCNF